MGIFKNTKTRNIFIYSICALGIAASIATICIVLWPKEDNATSTSDGSNHSSTNESSYQNNSTPNSNGHYYTTVSCEELSKITGENECQDNNSTPSYQAPYTTPPETPSNATPTAPTYNVPDYTPTYTPSCSEYHQKYYSEYTSKSSSIRSSYNNKISSASMSCTGQGGCPAVTNLKRQLDQEIATIKTQYKSNMTSVGCDPSQYVDF